jgi:two-component system response regulator
MEAPVILFVEDSEDDTFLFKWTFEKAGSDFRLHHAQNGAEAIEFLRHASQHGALPRIVLLDLKMPILNGFEVLTWMQQQTFSVPVVVLSGSAQEKDKKMALRLGALDYFVKPVSLSELQRILSLVPSNSTGKPWAEIGACR